MTQLSRRIIILAVALAGLGAEPLARADGMPELHLSIKQHRYAPERLQVPANVKFKLLVRNDDPTPEEFESTDLNREKIVPPGQEIPVFLGPLDPGQYKFFGDFHQDTAQGVMVAQ